MDAATAVGFISNTTLPGRGLVLLVEQGRWVATICVEIMATEGEEDMVLLLLKGQLGRIFDNIRNAVVISSMAEFSIKYRLVRRH
jgi:hypothetical protein